MSLGGQKLRQRARYGMDAPGVLYGCFAMALLCFVLQAIFPKVTIGGRDWPIGIVFILGQMFFFPSGMCMLLYGRYGKFRHRDRMLSLIEWKGNEIVLDVGTGLGLLLIGAAKKLTSGRAVGIDIWSQKDLSGNFASETLNNAILEGVEGKIEIKSEDARALSFANDTFDVILSNLCLHNIPNREGRDRACSEIARLLKKSGVALISDFQKTEEYTEVFLKEGLLVEKLGPYWKNTFLGLTILRVTKREA